MRIIFVVQGRIIPDHQSWFTSPLASTRYRVLLPGLPLRKMGHDVEVLHLNPSIAVEPLVDNQQLDEKTVCIISKTFGLEPVRFALGARQKGARVIVDFCDNNFLPPGPEGDVNRLLAKTANSLVVGSAYLAGICRKDLDREATVISDPYEGPRGTPRFDPNPGAPRLLWYGHDGNMGSLELLLDGLADRLAAGPGPEGRLSRAGLTVVTGNGDLVGPRLRAAEERAGGKLSCQFVEWSLETLWGALDACDLVTLPVIPDARGFAKSSNRMVEAIRAGRFAVANLLPAYQPMKELAWLGDDLVDGVDWALAHPEEVRRRLWRGAGEIEELYAPERIANQWAAACEALIAAPSSPAAMAPAVQQAAPSPWRPEGDVRLNLGCGDKILPGYLNVDIVPSRAGQKPQLLCDLHRKLPLADGSVDEILAVHVVEHFWRWETLDILQEWVRVLRPGGRMILECPNLLSACEEVLKNPAAAGGPGPEGQRSLWVLYGDPSWKDPLMCHRWAYTPQSLAQVMAEAGLTALRQEPAQFKLREPRDMRIVGERPG